MPVVDAPAKLTRRLHVTGVRPDGFHLIDAEMVTLDLCDRLAIEPEGRGLRATGPFAAGVPLDESNLVARALLLAGRQAAVVIDKQIPHGGGLGGGSADAAAVLRWAGYRDLEGASRLGADIAFCLVGGRAHVRGIGEIVDPLPHLPLDVTLVVPPLSVSTPAVYRAWDEMGGPTGHVNDLEPAAIAVVPALAVWRDRIEAVTGLAPTLAGSGATWFVEGHHMSARALEPEATVVLTRTRS
ncbi:MAG: 4-(cytidine 5'-diphospho)-2-C-methyl-D-erythritol kinase [Actinobacteria bacterium]|nr:4-(cytidine 5'-diphospho)-2-C-methyl-D-erythritol kinase [Actinomycetota bacterium]